MLHTTVACHKKFCHVNIYILPQFFLSHVHMKFSHLYRFIPFDLKPLDYIRLDKIHMLSQKIKITGDDVEIHVPQIFEIETIF